MSQFKFATLAFLMIGFLMFSCEQDDDMITPEDPGNPVLPTELDCDLVATGASRTLPDLGLPVDYILNCRGVVDGDLTIEPGVTIQFGTDAGIVVNESGSFSAVGTAADNIIFTGEDKVAGAWSGLIFFSNDIKNKLEYCTVEYAGGSAFNSNGDLGAIIIWADVRLNMANCTIQKSAAYGINASYSGSEVTMTDNIITQNDMPMYIDANLASGISGGSYVGNNDDAILLFGFRMKTDHTWLDLDAPYRLNAERELWVDGAKLVISAGVTMEFENGASLNIGDSDASTLIAVGTAQNPILFTGVVKQAGAWGGINFNFTQSPENEIAFATIEYAGNEANEGAVYLWADPVLNIHDVTIKESKTCGIKMDPLPGISNFTQSNNVFINNAGGDICEP